jgi:hypothetical protein
MLINANQIKKLCHSKGKNVSKEALLLFNAKLHNLVTKSADASNGNKTILGRDVANFNIKIGG